MRLKKLKNVTFDEMTHNYLLDDKQLLIGVTTLMKKHGLSPDYGGIDEKTLAGAATRGTAVHTLLEDYDNGKNCICSDVFYEGKCVITADMMQKNLDAYKKLGLQVHCSEYLVSDCRCVASFIDKVLEDGSLADVKTTSSLHKEALEWQLSIYAFLFESLNPKVKVPHLYAIHVRDGKAKLVEVNRIPDEEIEALLLAEAEGRIYGQKEAELEDISSVVGVDTALNIQVAEMQISYYKELIGTMETSIAEAREAVYNYMLEHNLTEMKVGDGVYKLKSPTQRETFDTKRFKKEHPEMAEQFIKLSAVRGSISFKKQ